MNWSSFHVQKRGNRLEEYEDACAANPEAGRFAVADGASESSFAARWARLLVEGFVTPEQGRKWFAPLRKRWADEVDGLTLPWYAEEKRTEGAFATFLGLVVKRSGKWRATAIGDACLFQIRESSLVTGFPVAFAKEFSNSPNLLCSRPGKQSPLSRRQLGEWRRGDRFFLMTDALADWFLRQCEAGRQPWQAIAEATNGASLNEDFANWINDQREKEYLRNDDVTLLSVEIPKR